jgi:hypothetical protein
LDNKEGGIQVYRAPTGTSAAAALRRLCKDRPDIHARVLAGEISAHAGMVEADHLDVDKLKLSRRLDKWNPSARLSSVRHIRRRRRVAKLPFLYEVVARDITQGATELLLLR